MTKMKPHEIRAAVSQQINASTGQIGGDISQRQSDLMDRYMGEPYGDEVKGRSSVVSTDISDVVEWIMPEMLDIFASGNKTAEFDPVGPEDEDAADQETDVVNHVFQDKNQAFLILYSWIKDALILKNGVVKRYWDERTTSTIEEYGDLTREEMFTILEKIDGEVDVMEVSGGFDEETGEESPLGIKIKITKEVQELKVVNVPPEEFIIAPRWNSVFLDGCPFCAHKRRVTISELIEMGFDRKQVQALPTGESDEYGDLKVRRFETDGSGEYDDYDEADESMREPMVYECYIRMDRNGDGIAELLKIWVGGTGNEILKMGGNLAIEEIDAIPFSAFTPIIVPHRHFGRSIAELIDDLQRIKTVLSRQMLDNVYLLNHGRPEIASDGVGQHTITDLLNARPGAAIRTAMPGMLKFHYPGDISSGTLQVLEYIDSVRETRTGVTKHSQGLDADALNQMSGKGIRQIMTAAQKKVALIARIFAETGLKDLLLGLHRDLRKGPIKKIALRLRGEWVEVDPRTWAERADMTIRVGLGTGDRESKRAGLMLIAQFQEKMLASGFPMVEPRHIYATAERMVENEGFTSAETFFADPAKQDQQQPMQQQQQQQSDPAQLLAQVEMQKIQADSQAKEREAMMKMQIAAQQSQLDFMKMRAEDDRKRDEVNVRAGVDLQKAGMQGETALSLEAVKQLNQPPMGGPNGR